jgi:hypothetical protein
MGSAENVKMAFHDPTRGDDVVANVIEAGEYWGIAVDVASVSKTQMDRIYASIRHTKTQIKATAFAGLAKDDLFGDMLFVTALAYHAEMDMLDKIHALVAEATNIRLPSLAIFKTSLSTYNIWGIPVSAYSNGLAMDVDRLLSLDAALDGDDNTKLQFALTSGMNSSALEHLVPERLLSLPGASVHGVSAAKVLQLASVQGVSVYTVTNDNMAAVLPLLMLDDEVVNAIRDAARAGLEVTVPKTKVDFYGTQIEGYIITDPFTGMGAYMISTGDGGAQILKIMAGIFALPFSFMPVIGGRPEALETNLNYIKDNASGLYDNLSWFYDRVAPVIGGYFDHIVCIKNTLGTTPSGNQHGNLLLDTIAEIVSSIGTALFVLTKGKIVEAKPSPAGLAIATIAFALSAVMVIGTVAGASIQCSGLVAIFDNTRRRLLICQR